MASVTCGLTAEDRDQLRNHTLVSSMGLPLVLLLSYYYRYQYYYWESGTAVTGCMSCSRDCFLQGLMLNEENDDDNYYAGYCRVTCLQMDPENKMVGCRSLGTSSDLGLPHCFVS